MSYADLNALNKLQDNNITNKPHVVILGAGASRAACPDGDRNKHIIPLMNDFRSVLNLNDIIDTDGNFEEIYSDLYAMNDKNLEEIENRIYNYFNVLELPIAPTIYDYLILSLRKKDIIASFNWDPFLIQAYQRNSVVTDNLPAMLFLHGNVWEGRCNKCKTRGFKNRRCPKCGSLFLKSALLYPIKHKDYYRNINVRYAWDFVKDYLQNAAYLTVFGYSTPKSDIEAKELFVNAWGNKNNRFMEQIEIIDIQPKNTVLEKWKELVVTDHYDYINSYFESQIFRFPRRSVEAHYAEKWIGNWLEREENPQFNDINSLQGWFMKVAIDDSK